MNLERIAEIEADLTSGAGPGWPIETNEEAAELCRLARLGLLVEGAPVVGVYGDHHCAFIDHTFSDEDSPHYIDRRVALVLLEDSK